MAWYYKVGVKQYLTTAQVKQNAIEFYNYFTSKGATVESICGMLGNIEQESSLNPGQKQGLADDLGWGLIQWSPHTDLTNWATENKYNWYDGGAQCIRIWLEGTDETLLEEEHWKPTSSFTYSWEEFIALTDVEEATKAYLYERERAGTEELQARIDYANAWYEEFTGEPPEPTPPTPPTPITRKKMPLYMYLRRL